MITRLLTGITLIIVAIGSSYFYAQPSKRPVSPPWTPRPFYLGGIQVNEPNLKDWVKTVQKAGMNTVAVTVYAKQGNWDDNHLWFKEEEQGVIEEIRAAKAQNLKVVLILRVALQHKFPRNTFMWHGMIMPRTDSLRISWFEKYEQFTLKWAAICEQEGVEVLGIGSELNALSATKPITALPPLYDYYISDFLQKNHEYRLLNYADQIENNHLWIRGNGYSQSLKEYLDTKIAAQKKWGRQVTLIGSSGRLEKMNQRRAWINNRWTSLIKRVRQVYLGKLTYAANFDNYQEVGFWQHLDFVGINAYFQLRQYDTNAFNDVALQVVFEQKWQQIFDDIYYFKKENQIDTLPILFTELGYINKAEATLEPWAGFGFSVVGNQETEKLIIWEEQPIDSQERVLAVQALQQVISQQNEPLAGILYWKLTTQQAHLGIEPFALHLSNPPTDALQEALVHCGNMKNNAPSQ